MKKNVSTTTSQINFSKVKINELLSCFKFYAIVEFITWYSRVFKRKTNVELIKNTSKIISYTALKEKRTSQTFTWAMYGI